MGGQEQDFACSCQDNAANCDSRFAQTKKDRGAGSATTEKAGKEKHLGECEVIAGPCGGALSMRYGPIGRAYFRANIGKKENSQKDGDESSSCWHICCSNRLVIVLWRFAKTHTKYSDGEKRRKRSSGIQKLRQGCGLN